MGIRIAVSNTKFISFIYYLKKKKKKKLLERKLYHILEYNFKIKYARITNN